MTRKTSDWIRPLLVVAACAVVPATARAQTPQKPPSRAAEPARGEWGWAVVVSSVVAGAALTLYGLTIECGDDDVSCQRRASLPIWGGVGVASLGTLIGIRIVQVGREPSTRSAAIWIGTTF
jgi:hypothetical protein